jgi:hypothetical protein
MAPSLHTRARYLMRSARFILLGLLAFSAACDEGPTAPVRLPASPTMTEHYIGTIGVNGAAFYSFTTTTYGTIELTLNSLSPDDGAVTLSMELGVPRGFGCPTSSAVTTRPGSTVQLTNVLPAGVSCVLVRDVGTLTGPTSFDVAIAYP